MRGMPSLHDRTVSVRTDNASEVLFLVKPRYSPRFGTSRRGVALAHE